MSVLVLGDLFYSYDYIAEDITAISEFIHRNHYTVVLNLEGSFARKQTFRIRKRGEHLAQSPITIDVLKMLNVKGVSLCNNHMFDFGPEGLQDTIALLREHGIQFCGAGFNREEASRPMRIDDHGTTYEFYGATDPFEESVCTKNEKPGCFRIQDLQKKVLNGESNTVKVAFLHTGFEYNTLPEPRTVKECRNLADHGFDAVICSHPHITQPWENYCGKSIYYSLGNFYFSSCREEFQNKEIHGRQKGFCNFGLGVVLDGGSTCTLGVFYDSEHGKTYLDEKVSPESYPILPANPDYAAACRENRNNHNPILTGHKVMDTAKILVLNFEYMVYRLLQNLGIEKAVKKLIFRSRD